MYNKFRFHLLSLVHLPQSKTYTSCAFTQKNRKLAKMLIDLGHEVFFYGSEGSDVAEYCNSDRLHFIQTHTLRDIRQDYGDGDNRFEIGYDWTGTDYRHDFNLLPKPATRKFIDACIREINAVKKPDDFLLMSQGFYFKEIADKVKLFLTCEPGVGYRGSYCGFRAFESSYIQNFTYGSEHPRECINGSHYDRVIPNYFDDADYTFKTEKQNYYLFIGRIIKRKGIVIAHLATKAIGGKLIIAGQGGKQEGNRLWDHTDTEFSIEGDNFEYVGFADNEKRRELFANARATFTPTEYLECFAGTHIESMLSGTPVITTDFGVFGGTVINGVNGYRCDTLDDFVWAAQNIDKLDRVKVRQTAERYLMKNVMWDYQKWFEDLHDVFESSVDEKVKGFHRLYDPGRLIREKITW